MQSKPQGGNGVGYPGYWETYKTGVDDSNGFWLGLDEMHQLSKSGRYGVEIVIELAAGSYDFVNWPLFVVGDEASKYELTIASDDGQVIAYSRNSGTSSYFVYHNKLRFSSSDKDYDDTTSTDCATKSTRGDNTGWWYGSCGYYWNKYRSGSSWTTGKKTRMNMISRIGKFQAY